MTGKGLEPMEVAKAERWRYQGKEWGSLDEMPKELMKITFSNFEVLIDGKWRTIQGSYASSSGPMIWVEVD